MTTQELKDELRNRGYYTDNLWNINDVKHVSNVMMKQHKKF